MKRKYNYFYRIENKLNGHFYYGIHSTDNLDDGYMGSGRRLIAAYKSYGIEHFEKTILKFFDTREEASNYENSVVTEALASDDNCYNLVVGGEYLNTIGKSVVIDNEDGKCKMVSCEEYRLNKDRYRSVTKGNVLAKRIGEDRFAYVSKEEFENNKSIYTLPTTGKVVVKDKNGKHFCVSYTDERYLSGELVPNWKGRKHSEETKRKISMTQLKNQSQKGEKNSRYGTCWITKDGVSKSVNESELGIYITNGWTKGRTIHTANEKIASVPENDILQLRNQGMTWKSIANHFGVSEATIYEYKKKHKL